MPEAECARHYKAVHHAAEAKRGGGINPTRITPKHSPCMQPHTTRQAHTKRYGNNTRDACGNHPQAPLSSHQWQRRRQRRQRADSPMQRGWHAHEPQFFMAVNGPRVGRTSPDRSANWPHDAKGAAAPLRFSFLRARLAVVPHSRPATRHAVRYKKCWGKRVAAGSIAHASAYVCAMRSYCHILAQELL